MSTSECRIQKLGITSIFRNQRAPTRKGYHLRTTAGLPMPVGIIRTKDQLVILTPIGTSRQHRRLMMDRQFSNSILLSQPPETLSCNRYYSTGRVRQAAAGGGNYWSVASWYVTSTQAFYTTLVKVNVSQFLAGDIKLNWKRHSYCSYTSDFYAINGTSLTISYIPELVWCTETLEVYGVDQCSEFPNLAYSEMFGIYIYLNNGTNPVMNWSVTNAQPYCSTQTVIVNDGSVNGTVYIYF
jgi:hypothetical protein